MPGEDVMEVTGKNNKIFISSDTLFQNSKCLFVEYDDIIKSPQFILLQFIKEIDAIKSIFDLSEIEGKELEEMYEWYLLRQYKNIFLNFPVDKDTYASAFHNDNEIYYQFCDELLKTQLNKIPECFSSDAILNFNGTLQKLTWDGLLVKKVIVYCEYGFEHVKDDIEKRFNRNIICATGPLEDVIKKYGVTSDSTFIFSDAYKIFTLLDAGILDRSSVIIGDRYQYNYINENEFIIDEEKLIPDHLFKLDFFDAITS